MKLLGAVRSVLIFVVSLVLTLWVLEQLGDQPWYIYLPAGLLVFLGVEWIFGRLASKRDAA